MRRTRYVVLAGVALAWIAAAIALRSPTFGVFDSSAKSTVGVSPACLPGTLEHSARLPGSDIDVSPAPETGTANPDTQISFLGASASDVRAISVTGSESGAHQGHMRGYSQGDGESFVPERPFDPGERVLVHAVTGPASGGKPIAFGFRVDTPYPTAKTPTFPNPRAAPADYQSFYTLPGVQAPVLTVTVPDRDPAAGEILTTNGPGPGQYGPLIYTPQGRLVWFDRLSGGETAENLSEQTYAGRPALTWWKGRVLDLGFGQGEDIVMDGPSRGSPAPMA
jgi:hypothetical protein